MQPGGVEPHGRCVNVPRRMIGRYVEFTWRDPNHARVDSKNYEALPRGREALAVWQERGVIDDITDGIVRVEHSVGRRAKLIGDQGDDHVFSWVQEELIESLVTFTKDTDGPG